MSENPLVSIIVRTKDRPKLLEKALRSINAQTYRPIEVVLVNDGGCDLNEEILRDILKDVSLNYIRLKDNVGRARAGNIGIENAKGDYIGFLDDDDELYPEHLSILVPVLEEKIYRIAYTDANIAFLSYDSEKREMVTKEKRLFSSKDFSFKELIIDNYIPLMCILFSNDLFDKVGKFDEAFEIYEDWDLLIRMAEVYPFIHLKHTTAEYIQWSSTLQIAQTPEFIEKSHNAHLQIIKKHKDKITPQIFRELVLMKRALQDRNRTITELEGTKLSLEKLVGEKDKCINKLNEIKISLENELQERDAKISKLEAARFEIQKILNEQKETVIKLTENKEKLEEALKEKQMIIENLTKIRRSYENEIMEKDTALKIIRDLKGSVEEFMKMSKDSYRDFLSEGLDSIRRNFESILEEKEKIMSNLQWTKKNLEDYLQSKIAHINLLNDEKRNLEEQYLEKERQVSELENIKVNLEKLIKEKEVLIEDLENRRKNYEDIIFEKENTIIRLEKTQEDFEDIITRYQNMLKEYENALREKEILISELKGSDDTLKQVLNSHGWKMLLKYYNLRDKLFPENTKRRHLYNLILLAIYNPKSVFKSLNLDNLKRFWSRRRIFEPVIIKSEEDKEELTCEKTENCSIRTLLEKNRVEEGFDNTIDSYKSTNKEDSILIIDRWVPTYDKDSGSLRMFSLIDIFIDLGYKVTFLPDDLKKREPYVSEMQSKGIEVIYGNINVSTYLEDNGKRFNYVILSRPEQAYKYISIVRACSPNSVVIYDTVDLHWLRFERASRVSNSKEFKERAKYYKSVELFNSSCSDVIFTVTHEEKELLLGENPELKIEVVPNIHEVIEEVTPYNLRKDIMFIGGFLHQPNEDAVFYFVEEILPIIKEEIPEVKFYVVGSDPTAKLLRLNSETVKVTGYVRDIMQYFKNCKVFVSPLRYGAGMKGKIGQSMGYGLPVVTTTIGAEGIGLIHEENALIADEPKEFARETIRLYQDKILWEKLSRNSINHIKNNYSKEVLKERIRILLDKYKLQTVQLFR